MYATYDYLQVFTGIYVAINYSYEISCTNNTTCYV